MKIFSISMVRNEADIIESFIRYHLELFDGMVILDNQSADRTPQILQSLVAEGLPVYVIHDSTMDYLQAEKMTDLLYHTFEEYNPDLIFPLDADEFVTATRSKQHPRKLLNQLDLSRLHYLHSVVYFPLETDNEKELFIPKRIIHAGEIHTSKVVISQEIALNYCPAVARGNHGVIFRNHTDEAEVEKVYSEKLHLAHYALRSVEHALSKYVIGWLGHLSRPNRVNNEGFHWEMWFHQIKDMRAPTLHQFVGDQPHMKKRPIPLSFCPSIELKYTHANEIDSTRNILEYAESLAEAYAKLKAASLED